MSRGPACTILCQEEQKIIPQTDEGSHTAL